MTMKILLISILAISSCLFFSNKVAVGYQIYIDGQNTVETKIKKIAADLRSGKRTFSSDKYADLLEATANRDPERYFIGWHALMSGIFFNLAIAFLFLGYFLGKKAIKNKLRNETKTL